MRCAPSTPRRPLLNRAPDDALCDATKGARSQFGAGTFRGAGCRGSANPRIADGSAFAPIGKRPSGVRLDRQEHMRHHSC